MPKSRSVGGRRALPVGRDVAAIPPPSRSSRARVTGSGRPAGASLPKRCPPRPRGVHRRGRLRGLPGDRAAARPDARLAPCGWLRHRRPRLPSRGTPPLFSFFYSSGGRGFPPARARATLHSCSHSRKAPHCPLAPFHARPPSQRTLSRIAAICVLLRSPMSTPCRPHKPGAKTSQTKRPPSSTLLFSTKL